MDNIIGANNKYANGTAEPAIAPASPVTLNTPAPISMPTIVAYAENFPRSRFNKCIISD